VRHKAALGSMRIIRTLSPVEGRCSRSMPHASSGETPTSHSATDDIVFVPQTKLSRWNDVVQQILPDAEPRRARPSSRS
jgi:hypothetical protein